MKVELQSYSFCFNSNGSEIRLTSQSLVIFFKIFKDYFIIIFLEKEFVLNNLFFKFFN